jgi:hypothetical protein
VTATTPLNRVTTATTEQTPMLGPVQSSGHSVSAERHAAAERFRTAFDRQRTAIGDGGDSGLVRGGPLLVFLKALSSRHAFAATVAPLHLLVTRHS